MREEEKLLQGLVAMPRNPDLVALRHSCHMLCQEYNKTFEDETEHRAVLLHRILGFAGRAVLVQGPLFMSYGTHTSFGDNVRADYDLLVKDEANVTVGNRVILGPRCSLITSEYPMASDERMLETEATGVHISPCRARPITIGDDVWLEACVTVMGGVTIGKGSVIAAGSVVTEDIPEGVFAGGVPCRVIRPITDSDRWLEPQGV